MPSFFKQDLNIDTLNTTGDVEIEGNLTVTGTTTTVSTTNTVVSDKLIELGNGTSGSPSGDAGIIIERGSSNNAAIIWDESADTFVVGTTTATGASTGDLSVTDAALKASVITASTSLTLASGATVTAINDEDNMSSNSATALATQQSIKAYVDSQTSGAGNMDNWILEDDDGTEVTVSNGKEVKFIGSGITTNFTDVSDGSDADPFDLTFTVDAAQTGITSILATDLKIGEDEQTKIDFETADQINFYANNGKRVTIDSSGLTIDSGSLETATIDYTDGDLAITIADGGGITAANGITSTAAANTFGATSFNDANITNVGDIALDSISADGTDINVAVSDNSATALTIKQGSDAYLIVDTANNSESVAIGTGVSGTAISIGHGTSETTVNDNLTVTGDLTVNGTTTTINSTTLTVDDKTVVIASGASDSAAADGAGISIDGASATLTYAHSGTKFVTNKSLDVTGTLTATNLAGTLTTAAQTNITSVGTLTALTVDDVAVDGKVITMTGSTNDTATLTAGTNGTLTIATVDDDGNDDADLTLDIDGDIVLDSAEGKWRFKKATSGRLKIDEANSGDVQIELAQADKKLEFKGTDGSSAVTALELDMALAGKATFGGDSQFNGNATFGVDDTGVDVRIFSATTNEGVLYDASQDELGLLLTTKLKFHDIGGGEEIFASADGHLEVNAGTTLDMTAPTVDVNASTAITLDTPSVTISSATSEKPDVIIKNTTNDANGARLQFVKDKGAAGADGDDIGVIEFIGDDAAQTQTSFAKIVAEVSEADDSDEAGKLSFLVAESDGTNTALTAGLVIEGEHATDGQVNVTLGAGVQSITNTSGKFGVFDTLPMTAINVVNNYNTVTFENQLASGEGGGRVMRYSPGADDTLTVGELYFLHTDGTWNSTDASAVATGATQLLGIGLGNARTAGCLMEGFIRIPAASIEGTPGSGAVDGLPLYVSETAGHITFTRPTTGSAFVRIVGHAIDDHSNDVLIYFNPSNNHV